MRVFAQGLLGSAPISVSKRRVLACVGLAPALGIAIGLLVRAQIVVGANSPEAASNKVERQPIVIERPTVTAESQQPLDQHHVEGDGTGQLRPIALRSTVSLALPSPPLPSRVLPERITSPDHVASHDQSQALPVPPVPSKRLPGSIPDSGDNDGGAADEIGDSESN
jgi:hypothetical protein